MAKKKTFENIISNLLGEPVSNLCHAFYDQYVEANVKFRSRAGMKEVIIRRQLGKCCKWCADLAGIYAPEDAPDDIYRRHDNCKCMVTYKDEAGYTDVWSKKEFANQKNARITREKEILTEAAEKASKYETPVIDYLQSLKFADENVDLMNDLRSGNCQKACSAVDTILNKEKYGLPKSQWSGKTMVVDKSDMPDYLGKKLPSCEIVIRKDRLYDIKTIIHEDLHARSYCIYPVEKRSDILKRNIAIEEGTVEYLSQIICDNSNIRWTEGYHTYVKALKDIKKIVDPVSSDFEFAKKLIEIPLDERYNALEKIVDEYLKEGKPRRNVERRLVNSMNILIPLGRPLL